MYNGDPITIEEKKIHQKVIQQITEALKEPKMKSDYKKAEELLTHIIYDKICAEGIQFSLSIYLPEMEYCRRLAEAILSPDNLEKLLPLVAKFTVEYYGKHDALKRYGIVPKFPEGKE